MDITSRIMYTSVMIVVMCLSSVSMQNINHNSITDQKSNVNQSKTLLESDNLFNLLETKILNIETINLEDKRLKRDRVRYYSLCDTISNIPNDSQLKLKHEIMKANINVLIKMSFLNEVPSDFCESMMDKIFHLPLITQHLAISKLKNIIEELKKEDGLSPKEDDYENSDNNDKIEDMDIPPYPHAILGQIYPEGDNRVIDNFEDDFQPHSNNGDIVDENKYNINLKNKEQGEGSLIQNNVEDRVNDFNNEEQSEGSLRQNNDEDRVNDFNNEEQSEGSLRQNNDEDDNNITNSLDEPHIISRRKNKNRKKNKKRHPKNKRNRGRKRRPKKKPRHKHNKGHKKIRF